MKKVLFISPRNPFSGRFSGDVIRAKKFVQFFGKNYETTVVSPDKFNSKKKFGLIKLKTFADQHIFFKLFNIINSLIKFKPLQLGYFYSEKMHNYIKRNYKNFDMIFCQSVRAAQYVVLLNCKQKILDMGDLYSNNYFQTFKVSNIFNPCVRIGELSPPGSGGMPFDLNIFCLTRKFEFFTRLYVDPW